jgi:hypothetical protein
LANVENPGAILASLRGKASEREFLRFAAECARRVVDKLDFTALSAISSTEDLAEGRQGRYTKAEMRNIGRIIEDGPQPHLATLLGIADSFEAARRVLQWVFPVEMRMGRDPVSAVYRKQASSLRREVGDAVWVSTVERNWMQLARPTCPWKDKESLLAWDAAWNEADLFIRKAVSGEAGNWRKVAALVTEVQAALLGAARKHARAVRSISLTGS